MVPREQRHCTDVVCLLLFILFWGGMGFVGFKAFSEGDPQRILYGLDSYGNYCGMLNVKANGTTVDLRHAPKLYYLDPLELLDPSNYYYARTVCVPECPGAMQRCDVGDFPCTDPNQYVCPYYGFSPFTLDGADALGIADASGAANTGWWSDLPALNATACVDEALLATIPDFVTQAFNGIGSCGQYYQMTSMYPGEGPCSAVLFETTEFMQRCYPVIPQEALGNVSAVAAAGVAAGVVSVSREQLGKVRVLCHLVLTSASNYHLCCARVWICAAATQSRSPWNAELSRISRSHTPF